MIDVRGYVRITERTDQLEPKTARSPNYKIMPILGLAGEIGSLLTELKKRVREPNRATDLGNKRIEEELGDIVWYAVTIARRAKLDFGRDVLLANLARTQNTPGIYLPHLPSARIRRRGRGKPLIKAVATFNAYQRSSAKSARLGHCDDALVPYLVHIWKNSGELLKMVSVETAAFTRSEQQKVAQALGDVMWYVAGFATLYGLKLDDVVQTNTQKVESMFMPLKERRPTRLHDEDEKPLEQFPRRFNIDFVPTDDDTSVMLINGMRLGDPLRDNAYQIDEAAGGKIDGYRFHDCVHLAFVAVLGWSPVIRGLMKRKRKSNKMKDDADDGARAQIVDEMIVKLTHSYAVNVDKNELLKGRDRIDMDLLKQIQILTAGLEVRANKLWEWEKAILLGYAVFDRLRQDRQGRLTLDLATRNVTFSRIKASAATRFPRVA